MSSLADKIKTSYLSGGSMAYLEGLYELYLLNPQAVESHWQEYFRTLQAQKPGLDKPHSQIIAQFAAFAKQPRVVNISGNGAHEQKEIKVLDLIETYRLRGHLQASINPLEPVRAIPDPGQDATELGLKHHGLSAADLSTKFNTGNFSNIGQATLAEIYQHLQKTYCGTIAWETMHVSDEAELTWLQNRIELKGTSSRLSVDEKKRVLEKLIAADGLEKYLNAKYPGQKRFSLEGGDSLIPALDQVIECAAAQGVKESVIGMAHRGRLNVLINTVGKPPRDLFNAFEGKYTEFKSSGDVKYHQGFSSDVKTKAGAMHMVLAFNPSHLEIISPVVQGSVRGRQERYGVDQKNLILPILIHGDASFSGQGVVMEDFNMSQTRGFGVGGSIHIVVNNQVGFTTSAKEDARSSLYCSDIAKMIEAPIFHVNADDPEAVVCVARLALDYRMAFNKNVVIDLVCYRRHGHNEADEPSGTQPLMYQKIRQLPATRERYATQLLAEGTLDQAIADQMLKDYYSALDKGDPVIQLLNSTPGELTVNWKRYLDQSWDVKADTTHDLKKLQGLASKMLSIPKSFNLQTQVEKLFESRLKMNAGESPIDWGFAENLAYASLLNAGHDVRLVGQDSGRGTFAHRHAALHDQKTDERYIPLQHLTDKQGRFTVIDSILSEEAVLAFEYGYATTEPNSLVLWEAQFGDFVNGAQVVIDQFISSGEQKWGRLCGLVMLLPHGYEGMGPEHSSARLERFMQLCAQKNMQVCVPTTPAQAFHMLRRQMIRPYRKPLVVMTPKSLLRHKLAVSTLEDLAKGQFHTVIPEIDAIKAKKVKRVILCSGKVYYDLLEKRRAQNIDDIAIIRIEQLYPFPEKDLKNVLEDYAHVTDFVWCQEEPKNQGAWYSTQHWFLGCLSEKQKLSYAGRPRAAAPAAGYLSLHQKEQQALVEQALGLSKEKV